MTPMTAIPYPRRATCVLALVATLAACDFGVGGTSGGCARISQGDYTMPTKRIVRGAVATRLTQSGMDFISERIRDLVLAFFDADAEGRAVIPLATLGVGDLSTSLGPFDARLRDLVLVVDLAALDVRFVPGSSPARVRVRLDDAVVGLADGVVAGTIDAFLFSGDAACRLANGPAGRVARLDLLLELELATTTGGTLAVRVLPSTVNLEDVALAIEVDCTLPECLDGLTPPSTAECGECNTICPAADLGSALVSLLQGALSDLVDGLLTLLADDLANLLLDGFLNGRPLAVEGRLDLATLLGPVLSWFETARPLGVLARPTGDAFAISGSGDSLGLDVVLDAGVDAEPAHPCVGSLGVDPVYEAGPRPVFAGRVTPPEGGPDVPYDLALGVSDAIVNATVWGLYRAGALCIDVTTDDLATATGGALVVTARALDLLLPGVSGVAGPDAPVRVRLRPDLAQAPAAVRFGDGVAAPLIALDLRGAHVALDVAVGEHFMRVIGFKADLTVGLQVDALPGAQLGLRVEQVAIDRLEVGDDLLFGAARLDLIAPFVVDLAVGVLTERPLTLELGTGGLTSGLGIPIEPVVIHVGATGVASDWLAIYVAFVEPATPLALAAPSLRLLEQAPGRLAFTLEGAGPADAAQVRVAGGGWSRVFVGPGPHHLAHPRLWLVGDWLVEARAVDLTRGVGPAVAAASVRVVGSPGRAGAPAATEATSAPPAPQARPAPSGSGCAGGGSGAPLASLSLLGLVLLGLRGRSHAQSRGRSPARPRAARRRLAPGAASLTALAALLALGSACAADEAPGVPCAHHDQCAGDYLCGPQGVCLPASPCVGDGDCCPGAVCFSGWCRPTSACDPAVGRTCEGLGEVCEAGQCVPAACADDSACVAGRCLAGRCVVVAPCGGGCAAGEACHLPSDRCVAAACPAACGSGEAPVVAEGVAIDPLSCSSALHACVCAPLPEVEPGRPGVDGRLVALGDGPVLVSHDPRWGDLVVSAFASPGGGDASRRDRAVAGVPAAAPTGRVDGYRGGVDAPGPRAGVRPSVVVSETAGGAVLDLLHRDGDAGALRYLRYDPATSEVVAESALPIAGDVGRWSCLARRSLGAAGSRLGGLAFVETTAAGEASALVSFEALVDPPVRDEDWVVATVFESPRPPSAEAPCDGECGLTSVCVRPSQGGGDRCGAVVGQADACPGGCGPHGVCARLEDGAPAVCAARVVTRTAADELPHGRGLFVSCAVDASGGLVAAWYDADRRALEVGWSPFSPSRVATADAREGADPGRHARIAVAADGRLGVAYRDERAGGLRYAEAATVSGPWASVEVDGAADGRDPGAWPDLAFDAQSRPVIVYGDGVGRGIAIARRGAGGCWGRAPVFTPSVDSDGGYAWPSVVARGDDDVWVAAYGLAFSDALAPLHGPRLAATVAPPCAPR